MYIAVASGKGGTGKTLISTSLALTAGNCTFVDLDVEEPNGYIFLKPKIVKEIKYTLHVPEIDEGICNFCEKCSSSCMYHALTVIPSIKKTLVFPDLCHSCGVCSYVCPVDGALKEVQKEIGSIALGNSGEIRFIEGKLKIGQPSGVPLISGILTKYLNDDGLIIVDSSPGTSCPVVESIKGSDYILLVTEPNPFGLNDLTLMVEIVKDLNKHSGIIINKDNGRFNLIDDFAKKENIPILYRIPYSIVVQESYSKGVPIVESTPALKKDFENILGQILANG